jgi:simple sugar transport system permease protein
VSTNVTSSIAAESRVAAPPAPGRIRRLIAARESVTTLPALVALCIISTLVSPTFATGRNLENLLQQASVLSVLSLAMLLVLLSGRFDLSIESTVGFAPMLAVLLVIKGPAGLGIDLPPALGLIAAFAIGGVIGLFNGFLVVKLRLNAFITTLAMLILLRGATLGISSGHTVSTPPEALMYVGSAQWLGVPVSIIISGLLFVLVAVFLRYHRIGRNIYAIGGNARAARAAGIDVDRTVWGLYVVAGLMATLAGLMLSGRIDSVVANQGQNAVFDVFAALAIGGVSLNGGRGSVLGVLIGVLFLSVLANVLVLSGVPSFWVDMARGAIIVGALVLARYTGGEVEEDADD